MMRAGRKARRILLAMAPLLVGAGAVGLGGSKSAHATGEDKTELDRRCATRLSIAMLGASPTPTFFTTPDPQGAVDQMLTSPAFIERFSRFVNATFNSGPGALQTDDAVYFLTKYVLANAKPWTDLFIGPYAVDVDATKNMVVSADPNGLGYFRSLPWQRRYAGNETAGYKLSTAYRMVNNVVGVELTPSVAKPGDDRTSVGRKAAACTGCHYDSWFALDKIAKAKSKNRHVVHQATTPNNSTKK